MMKSGPPDGPWSEGAPPLPPEDVRLFGFTSEADGWMDRVQCAESMPPPELLGSFAEVCEVSRGGQGIIYRARQRGTNRLVAIKRLQAGVFASPSHRRRFEREMEAAANLRHPGVVTVFGMETICGIPHLTMEWIDGISLADWARQVRARTQGSRAILEAFLQVCDAVHHAHQNGVLHRDIKPANVLVDRQQQPRIVDFGLAKLLDSGTLDATVSGEFFGTPGYAAPETFDHGAAQLDVRSDVFSLGVVLVEILVGERPFVDATGVHGYLEAIERGEFGRPSTRCPGLGREIDAIAHKAMARDPRARYQSVDGLAQDLRRYLRGEAVLAHPLTVAYQFRKWVRRNPVVSTLSTLLLLALIVLAGGMTLQSRRMKVQRNAALRSSEQARRALGLAEQASREAGEEAQRTQSVLQFLLKDVLSLPSVSSRTSVSEMLEEAHARAESFFVDEPRLECDVQRTLGKAMLSLGHLPGAVAAAEAALRVTGDHAFALPWRRVDALQLAAAVRIQRGRYDEAEALVSAADQLLAERDDLIPARVEAARTASNRLRATIRMGAEEFEAAVEILNQCIVWYQQTGENPMDILDLQAELAQCLHLLGRFDQGGQLAERALQSAMALYGEDSDYTTRFLVRVSVMDNQRGERALAERRLRRAHALLIQRYGSGHPQETVILGLLGKVCMEQSKLLESEQILREALEIASVTMGSQTREIGLLQFSLALCLFQQNRISEALEQMRRAAACVDSEFGPAHFKAIEVRCYLAMLLLQLSEHEEALAVIDEGVEFLWEGPGEEDDILRGLSRFAQLLRQAGQIQRALELEDEIAWLNDGAEPMVPMPTDHPLPLFH